jgi:hypothetical protein
MARPQVADGETASSCEYNNKQPRTNDKGWSSSLGVRRDANNHSPQKKKQICYEYWTDSLDKRPKPRNMDMRFGLWDVRSLYRAGSIMTVSGELSK